MLDSSIIERIRTSMPSAELALADKMALVRAEYIETDLDDRLRASIDAVLRTLISRRASEENRRRNETRALVVVGEAGTGKTSSLDRMFRTHPALGDYGALASECPIARVVVPAPCTMKALGVAILHALGYPLSRDLREHAIWTRVHETLQTSGKVILHLDEMHNLTDKANALELDSIRKALKTLLVSYDWPMGLVISGLPSLVPAMREIDEVRRRGRFIRIPLLSMPTDSDLVDEALNRCCKIADIRVPDGFTEYAGSRLSHAGLQRYGIVVELIHEAIEAALLHRADTLDIAHFATAYNGRTGCGDRMNPFIAPDWPDIDATAVLVDEMPVEPVLPEDPKPRKRRARKSKA
ncbi:type II secretory pathway predicted ATPase ExeA [Bosea sp. OAE752]|uniref:ATP-binding protein n=1 Tax=Bosea sp. OAE752 TaxID=2663873 RepID=UPI003D194642